MSDKTIATLTQELHEAGCPCCSPAASGTSRRQFLATGAAMLAGGLIGFVPGRSMAGGGTRQDGGRAKVPGDDGGCFAAALEAVRRWGGVLEHPAHSKLWDALDLPKPGELPDAFGGRTIEVEQVRWGHVARKRTWLVAVGASRLPHPEMSPKDAEHAYCVSGPGKTRTAESRRQHAIELMGKRERELTPLPFARLLVDIAVSVRQ